MHARRLVAITTCVISLSWSFATLAQTQAQESCAVQFSEPKAGGTVSGRGKAKGTATVPPGKHLWIFAHPQGTATWWPQCGGPVVVEDGKPWVCLVTYGQDQDHGSDFEVAADVLDEKDDREMRNVVKSYQGKRANEDYSGVDLPSPAEGCSITKIIVMKK